MDQVRLGNAGVKVSRLCLGCMTYGEQRGRAWALGKDEARPFFRRAIEAGITFFDTANVYSEGTSEEFTGALLAEFAPRHAYVLATKVYFAMGPGPNDRGLSRKHIMASIDASLKRLGTDHVDLYQIHRFDRETPIEETMEALHDVVKAGKARYIGASSMYAWQFASMQHVAEMNSWTKFVSMQNHYNLVYREEEREMNPYCAATGVGLIPWSPLARGFLTGNRRRQDWGETVRAKTDENAHRLYYRDEDFAVVDAVADIAGKRGVAMAQVALAWMLTKPGITAPIIGASKAPHLEDALAAVDLKLDAAEIVALETPYRPHPILGHT